MPGDVDEDYRRFLSAIERKRRMRRVEEAAEREPEVHLHDLAWGRIVQTLESGRNPSTDDLLAGIAGDPAIPERARNYAGDLLRGEAKPAAGPKPEWNLNHKAWQRTRDILLVEKVQELRNAMGGDAVALKDVFLEIEEHRWSAKMIWGKFASRAKPEPWKSETAEKRYSEAKRRLENPRQS